MAGPSVLVWFNDAPLPGIVPDPSIVVGGTGLLKEFLAIAARTAEPSALAVAAPFIGAGIVREGKIWQALPHGLLSACVLTQSRRDGSIALREMERFRWRSLTVSFYPRLHAKLYSVVRASGGGVCLVGSHNLTTGGFRTNEEAGVLFIGTAGPEFGPIIQACYDRVIYLASQGVMLADSLRWPNSEAA